MELPRGVEGFSKVAKSDENDLFNTKVDIFFYKSLRFFNTSRKSAPASHTSRVFGREAAESSTSMAHGRTFPGFVEKA